LIILNVTTNKALKIHVISKVGAIGPIVPPKYVPVTIFVLQFTLLWATFKAFRIAEIILEYSTHNHITNITT